MSYDLIIANGTVVHADRTEQADVAIKGEKIVPRVVIVAGAGPMRNGIL